MSILKHVNYLFSTKTGCAIVTRKIYEQLYCQTFFGYNGEVKAQGYILTLKAQ